jgi:phosphoglucomutase
LIDVDALLRAYHDDAPDPESTHERVAFGTSGHRGSAFDRTFNEPHILAITQAIVEYRAKRGIDGPVLIAKDTHALSRPAERTAIEVLAGNDVPIHAQANDGYTATPVLSRAILTYNDGRSRGLADGIIITPSHNPPRDGGFKYNPPHGGPAGSDATGWIEARANEILEGGNQAVRRTPFERAALTKDDFSRAYVGALDRVINVEAIRGARLRLGVHPLGGASLPIWALLAEIHGVDVEIVDATIDPTFSFMTLDTDGLIRMDPSSPSAMERLIEVAPSYDTAFATDPDADRHGIVCPSAGLMNPNRFLAVAIDHLLSTRSKWPANAIGKTLVSSMLIDQVVASHNRRVYEVPVGFKWFAEGLHDGSLLFGGEESAGASFLCFDGTPWTTDKDGILMGLLAAEILATRGIDAAACEGEITARFGAPFYRRIQAPADQAQRARLKGLSPDALTVTELAGDPITAILTHAPGNDQPIGGLKVTTATGWFAARPSGTEPISKIYGESMRDEPHLEQILLEAQLIVG